MNIPVNIPTKHTNKHNSKYICQLNIISAINSDTNYFDLDCMLESRGIRKGMSLVTLYISLFCSFHANIDLKTISSKSWDTPHTPVRVEWNSCNNTGIIEELDVLVQKNRIRWDYQILLVQ